MNITSLVLVVLTAMIFVLAGMVGLLYWKQLKTGQHLESLAYVFQTHLIPPVPIPPPEDDRASVVLQEQEEEEQPVEPAPVPNEKVEVVEGPPPLASKTVKQLKELLTQRGIPFGQKDSKAVLLDLLKATD